MFTAVILASVAVVGAFSDQQYQDAFVKFMTTHSKSYGHQEFQTKFETFRNNMDFIEQHNSNAENTHTVAINEFADLTSAEFKRMYNGLKYTHQAKDVALPTELKGIDAVTLPSHVDWRQAGAVTGIKNQGQCGSCWSFSTTGSIEGQHFLKKQDPNSNVPQTPQLVGLSEQNLMDCSIPQGNHGCGGGLMDDAFRYVITNGGIDTEASYPYTAQNGFSCGYKQVNRGACIQSYHDIPQGNEQALAVASAHIGPISVAIDAGQPSFQFYQSGIYYSASCSPTALDHGVLVVGYGQTGSGPHNKYWIVKNSWGTNWGAMQGYIWMAKDRNNNCGIASAASYPIITKTKC